MTSKNNKVIIVGGGPAGMISAIYASENSDVVLIEKNKILGRKLRITGKGRCNITNAADITDFFKNIPKNSKFLYSALYSYTNLDIISFFDSIGVKTKTERGGRVFPVSDSANEVTDALVRELKKRKVNIVCDEVTKILADGKNVIGVQTKSGKKFSGTVIVATGGVSYPVTGSNGQGHGMCKQLGHTITELTGSLVPVVTEEKWEHSLSGLSLKNVTLTVYEGKKQIFSELGELLFTHFGLSGPLVLSASAHMRNFKNSSYKICIDLKPGLNAEKLDARILRDFEEEPNRDIQNCLVKLMPKTLIPVVLNKAGIEVSKKINSVTKQERLALLSVIKSLTIIPSGFRPVSEAIITSGGINVKEINPSTMESKLYNNLYFAGEIIDVDAYTGGYNLQIAWSTGYLAGINASKKEL